MGYGDVHSHSILKGAGFETPHLDFLLQTGVVFTNAHSSASVCAPTRYALLTGNHVYRGRNLGGTWDHFSGSQIVLNQKTIADVLRSSRLFHGFFWEKPSGFHILKI